MRGEKVGGVTVIVAARVMSAAGKNEVAASEAMRDALGSDAGPSDDRGEQPLKGLPGQWRRYAEAG